MALPAEHCAFVDDMSDADSENAVVDNLAVPRTASRHWKISIALMVACAVVAVVALSHQPSATMDVAEVSATVEETLTKVKGGYLFNGILLHEPFKQCDGDGFRNSTCCYKGCACIKQSKFYSQCETPLGNKVCNLAKAKLQHTAWESRMATRKRISKTADMRVEQAIKMVADAKEAHQKAAMDAKAPIIEWSKKKKNRDEALDKANAEVDKVRKEQTEWADKKEHDARSVFEAVRKEANAKRDAKQSIANEKRAKADATKKLCEDTAKRHKDVKEELDKFAKADEKRKALTTVPGNFQDCTGPDICELGCVCRWKNKFYGQCAGIHGGGCDWKPAAERNDKLTKELPELEKHDTEYCQDKIDTNKDAEEAERIALEVGERSNKTIADAKKVMDAKIAPEEEKKHEAVKAAQDAADKKTASKVQAEKTAAQGKDVAVKDIHKKAHKLAWNEHHLDSMKKAAKKAKKAINVGKGAADAWALAAKGDRCLKGEIMLK